jgi:adenylate cyclase
MKRKILIAVADPNDRNALRQIVELEGHDVVQAEGEAQAIALAQSLEVDAFLLDIDPPRMNGLAVSGAIQSIDRYHGTPVIFIAPAGDDFVLQQILEHGGDDFIRRPLLPLAVRARLRTNLQRLEYLKGFERVRRILKQYLSKRALDIIETLSPTDSLPPPEERDLAVCFTDMRGFTAFSEEMEPTRLFSLVSSLLAEQVHIIHDYGGYVDKFGGDGVMAIFEGPDMVAQCCLCALGIIESVRTDPSLGVDVEEMRRIGIGINTGRAVIGNIGSPEHLDYSAIGNTVNLAARLCGQAQATSIAVSKAVRDAVGEDPRLHFHSERQVPIRGIKGLVTVYTLGRPS